MTKPIEPDADRQLQLDSIEAPCAADASLDGTAALPAGLGLAENGLSRLRYSEQRARVVPTALVDSSALLRAGLAHVLAGTRFRVVAACASTTEIPSRALRRSPCLVLVGLDRESRAILEQIPELKSRHEGARIVMLADQFRPQEFLQAIESGCDGYLIKNETSPGALLASLDLMLLSGVVFPRACAALLHACSCPDRDAPPPPAARTEIRPDCVRAPLPIQPPSEGARLSEREQLILSQLMRGLSNKRIARELNIAEATVKVHVKSLLRKTRMGNRTQAAIWGVSQISEASPSDPDRGSKAVAVHDPVAAD